MPQVHFTLKQDALQKLLEESVKDVKDQLSLTILTTVFNTLMEQQIGANEYERSEGRVSQRNGYYERKYTTLVGSLNLRVPRTRDGLFSPYIFERYQRNEKALVASMLDLSERRILREAGEHLSARIQFRLVYREILPKPGILDNHSLIQTTLCMESYTKVRT